ncbi:MAG: hypothetical protein VYA67_21780 [Actinomycetota bacterium]|nr:hypothetical protein [Actinomycetota bacterium]
MNNQLFYAPAPPVPPTHDEIRDALEDARQLLGDGRVLAKGHAIDWVDGWPCWCIVGAITRMSRTTAIRDQALAVVRWTLPGRYSGRRIEDWNDHPDTTLDKAKALLHQAKQFVGTVSAA